jgi:hypothetical protein
MTRSMNDQKDLAEWCIVRTYQMEWVLWAVHQYLINKVRAYTAEFLALQEACSIHEDCLASHTTTNLERALWTFLWLWRNKFDSLFDASGCQNKARLEIHQISSLQDAPKYSTQIHDISRPVQVCFNCIVYGVSALNRTKVLVKSIGNSGQLACNSL